jgi:hypothetical protein
MHSNIPINKLRSIIKNVLTLNVTEKKKIHNLLNPYDTFIGQNYFTHKGKTVQQKDDLAIGSLSSAVLSEIHLQHMEFNFIVNITQRHNLLAYFSCVN